MKKLRMLVPIALILFCVLTVVQQLEIRKKAEKIEMLIAVHESLACASAMFGWDSGKKGVPEDQILRDLKKFFPHALVWQTNLPASDK